MDEETDVRKTKPPLQRSALLGVKLRAQAFDDNAVLPVQVNTCWLFSCYLETSLILNCLQLKYSSPINSLWVPQAKTLSIWPASTIAPNTQHMFSTRLLKNTDLGHGSAVGSRREEFILCEMKYPGANFTSGHPSNYFNLVYKRKSNHAFTFTHFLASSLYCHFVPAGTEGY